MFGLTTFLISASDDRVIVSSTWTLASMDMYGMLLVCKYYGME